MSTNQRPWLIAYVGLAVVGYLLAGTALNAVVVMLYYLIAMGVTYAYFEQASGNFMALIKPANGGE